MTQARRELNHTLTTLFRRADRALKRRIELRVKDTGVYRSQHRLLMHLSWKPDSCQAELAKHLEISQAALTVSLQKLEKGGYIRRETNSADGRSHRMVITEKGQQLIARSISMFEEEEAGMFEGFTEEELVRLKGFLERINRNLGEKNAVEERK